MEYRKLPRGGENESFSVLGLGTGSLHNAPEKEIEQTVTTALENGINFFDLCAGGKSVYEPFGRAIAGARDKVFFQLHFGAVYNEAGDYAWSRSLNQIKKSVAWELEALGTDYIDMGYLHCVDAMDDYSKLESAGVFDYLKRLHDSGVVRHMGFSSHTPEVADKLLDLGFADMMMFSINPAYDLERGDEYGIGAYDERQKLFRRCEAEGVGISAMKPFHGGKLLDSKASPFKKALTRFQCLQYTLDRPGVLTVVPGIRGMDDLKELLGFAGASREERDYSVLGDFRVENMGGNCVYCNHCQPCAAGIDVGLVNKYYDLARIGDRLAAGHYEKLAVKADACLHCGHCNERCPFKVNQSARMKEIADYFSSGNGSEA